MNGTLTTVLVATVAFVIGTVIPDQTGVYAALIGGLVTFCAALAGGITALLSAAGDISLGRARSAPGPARRSGSCSA